MHSIENNPLKQAILNTVGSVLEGRTHGAPGIIQRFYQETRLADVYIDINGQKIMRKNVPFSQDSDTIATIHEGQSVWIDFKGGNIQDAIIVSRYDPQYFWSDTSAEFAQYSPLSTDM